MLRSLSRWINLSRADRLLFTRAWIMVAAARIALYLLPFRLLLRRPPVRRHTEADPKRLAWAINASANYVPKATCLVRALAAQRLFARYGHVAEVRIGIAKPDGHFAAHAWLDHDGTTLIGGSAVEYNPILVHASGHKP